MINLLVNFLVSGVAVYISSQFLPGIKVTGFLTALKVALVLAIVNAIIKPVLVVLTLPINFFTLGLFTFVINALMVMLVSFIVTGFSVDNFWWALLFSVVVSLINSLLHWIFR